MVKDLLVRGLDDTIHSELSAISSKQAISINSIVKDAVEKWLQKNDRGLKKHDLILYTDDKSFTDLIEDIDKLAIVNRFAKVFYGHSKNRFGKIAAEHSWYKHTTDQSKEENRLNSLGKIAKELNNKKSCCIDFEIDQIIQQSGINNAILLERKYNSMRQISLLYCFCEYENLIRNSPDQVIRLFAEHDQVFLLQESGLFKIHISRENVHKLFLN